MATLYSLNDTINDFFRTETDTTQEDCDKLAQSLVGGHIQPVPIQGSFSYTVCGGPESSKIVQFRAQKSDLELEILNLSQRIHVQFVANYDYHGTIGSSLPLSVYVMNRIHGITYIEFRCANDVTTEMSMNTVMDLGV
jgi:hypothetical protein